MARSVKILNSTDKTVDIEKVYFGAASKGNDEFTTTAKHIEIDYSSSSGLMQLLQYVNSDNFVKSLMFSVSIRIVFILSAYS